MLFLILFILIPTIELYTMLAVGDQIGALSTVLLVLATAFIGGFLVRYQGYSVALKAKETLAKGEQPNLEVVEGACLMLSGLMLLLPGFITDFLGFILLIPPIRQFLILRYLKNKMQPIQTTTHYNASEQFIIEGKCERED